jgi:hypothetical protein
MPSPLNITNIPAPRVEFIDPRTGLMSREWYRFFLNLFVLTGSGSNVASLQDLQLGSPTESDIASLVEALNKLTQATEVQLGDTKAQQALDYFTNITTTVDFSALAPAPQYNNSVDTNLIDFQQNVPHVGKTARLVWNDADGTLDLGLKGGNVTLQVGQEEVVRVVNKSGSNLIDGQVVYISGAQGNRVKVDLAVANGSSTLARTVIGLVTEPILNNQEGFVTISGLVRNLDTSAFTDGDVLYLSTTPGAITNIPPTAPTHKVVVGFCINANPAVGSIFVTVQPGYDLEDLSDVAVTTPASGNLLIYNATTQVWENNLISAGSGISVTNGPGTITIAATGSGGSVTSVAQTFTGGLISVSGSPITTSGTLALTVAGTSGGIPYFSSASTWASSAVLAANALMVGGGAGVAPSTRSTGANVLTALGVAVGTAGSFVVNGGVLGTPSSGTVTNLTGTASININGTVGATTANTGAFTSLAYTTTLTGGTGIVNLGSSQFYKDASGNVGIGVTPSYRLHVVGGYSVIGAHNTTTLAGSSGTGGAAFSWNRSGGSAETNITNVFDNSPISFEYLQKTGASTANTLYQMASTAHIFYISNTERMRIDSSGNVGVGATANASAILDVQSTTKGFRLPNMTTTQKNAISSPAAGLMVFDTTLAKACVYSGSAWQTITSI